MGRNMLGKECHIFKGCAGLGETGGGLDVIGAGIGNALAKGDLLVIRQQAGLDDDLQELALAGSLDGSNFGSDLLPLAFLGPANVDDHVHFIGAVVHSIGGHEAFGSGGGIAVGEADDGADG